jgi:cytochrome c oxidase subunit 3
MLVALGGITMLFVAFTSAYVVRKGLSNDWQATPLPSVLWASTVILLGSSWTLEKARKSLPEQRPFLRWWSATTILGLLFLAGQLAAWAQLRAGGMYVSTNPSSSFFYVLTGAHGVHLVGGVTALLYLSWKFLRGKFSRATPRTAVGVMSIYWHFMDVLWVYLFLLLLLWR